MASSSNVTSKKLTLKSSDGKLFELEEEVATLSVLIKNMVEDGRTDVGIIFLPNVSAPDLATAIEYCRQRRAAAASSSNGGEEGEQIKKFDSEFVKDFDFDMLLNFIVVADYLNIPGLKDSLSWITADRIKDKSIEEIREIFHLQNDFTPEEEEAIRKKHEWAFN